MGFLMLVWTIWTFARVSSAAAVEVNGSGVGAPVVDVTDTADQRLHGGEVAAADHLTGDEAEPGLDLVDPAGTRPG